MALPNVNIEIANGQLGAVGAPAVVVPAMILTGVGATNIPLATPKLINSLSEAEDLGITPDTNSFAHKHIREFYYAFQTVSGAPKCPLYVMLVTNTVTLCDMVDSTKPNADAILSYAKGRIRLLGVARNPAIGYTPVVTGGVDKDSLDALPLAHTTANTWAKTHQAPLRVLVEGRAFSIANVADLTDLKTKTTNRAGIVLWGTDNAGSSVGYTLGVKAALPFVRKISRVANGAHSFGNGVYVGDTLLESVPDIAAIHDKGYITMRTYPTRADYYFANESMAVADTDDYAILSRGLVIDEAQRIAYDTLLSELENDVEVDTTTGDLLPGYKAYVERNVVNAVTNGLNGQISGVRFTIPEGQNVLSTNSFDAELGVMPKGYNTYINLKLGFVNPALNEA